MQALTKVKLFRVILSITYPISLVLVYPFAMMRKKSKDGHFFFFDRYVLGGAPRVHLDVLESIPHIHKEVFFTRTSENESMKQEFYSLQNTQCSNIARWCENLFFRVFSVHYFAFYINRHKKAHVFASCSTFFFDLLPFLSRSVFTSELLHNFIYTDQGLEFFALANYTRLSARTCVDYATRENIITQYKEYSIPELYYDRITVIEPGVTIEKRYPEKPAVPPLKVLYAGRGGAQKRLHLLDRIAQICIAEKLPVEFHFAGNMMSEISDIVKENSVIHGEIRDQQKMVEIYRGAHVLLLTSAFEGFPMTIKEGMPHGCISVSTALTGVMTRIVNMENGLIIDALEDEEAVVEKGVDAIKLLLVDDALRNKLHQASYGYAIAHFDIEVFNKKYTDFFAKAASRD